MKQFIKHLLAALESGYLYIHIYRHEKAALVAKKHLWKEIRLTAEQQKEIRGIYGNRVSNKWHRLYQAYTGRYNKDYFPDILFSAKLEPALCPHDICTVLQDKSLAEILYASVPGLKFPKTIALNCSGIYYDGNRNIINRNLAIGYVEYWSRNAGFIIKPTVNAGSGKDVREARKESGLGKEEIGELFDRFGENYIVQECVTNCGELSAIYDKSLNIFRIMTYILGDKLYHTPLVLRLGCNGSGMDHELYIGVENDGRLRREAYSSGGERYTVHPDSGVVFEDVEIPGVPKIIECAQFCHKKTPHTKFITWDFTIDKNNNPVLIEANMLGHSSWFLQLVYGEGIFGEHTKQMLELIGMGQ